MGTGFWCEAASHQALRQQCHIVQRGPERTIGDPNEGRWPANVIHDGSDEVVAAFPETTSGALNQASVKADNNIYGKHDGYSDPKLYAADSGSAARFFYTAKADSDDRLGSRHPTVKPTLNLCNGLCGWSRRAVGWCLIHSRALAQPARPHGAREWMRC